MADNKIVLSNKTNFDNTPLNIGKREKIKANNDKLDIIIILNLIIFIFIKIIHLAKCNIELKPIDKNNIIPRSIFIH